MAVMPAPSGFINLTLERCTTTSAATGMHMKSTVKTIASIAKNIISPMRVKFYRYYIKKSGRCVNGPIIFLSAYFIKQAR